MQEFKITFWKKPYNSETSFVKDFESIVTSAIVVMTTNKAIDTFHIKLTDIGLDSLYGEFDIVRNNGFWKTSDNDSVELNFLKWNIISELSILFK